MKQKKPGIIEQEIAPGLTSTIHLVHVKDYPKTTAAMDQVATTEVANDAIRLRGSADDYTSSTQALLSALDTFVRERSDNKKKAGNQDEYDLSKPCHQTLFLLWQIRHTFSHAGGVVDEKCKKDYERIHQSVETIPAIPLPEEIDVGDTSTFEFEPYMITKECLFAYLSESLAEADVNILRTRSIIAHMTSTGVHVGFIEGGTEYYIDVARLYEVGGRLVEGMVILPYPYKFDFERKVFYCGSDALPLPAITKDDYLASIPKKLKDKQKGQGHWYAFSRPKR